MSLLGIIGGTGFTALAGFDVGHRKTVQTPYGSPSDTLTFGRLAGKQLVFLPRHGATGSLAPHRINYRANLWALMESGVDQILMVNAVGGISAACRPGMLVFPHDLVDYTWGREQTYFDGAEKPLKHVEFSPPYDEGMRGRLVAAAAAAGIESLAEGVYAATQGPRLETAAEIRRLARDGCDVVGMTGMPEAALARELAIPAACCALVVNLAAGIGEGSIHAEIERVLDETGRRFYRVLERFLIDR